MEKRCPGRKNIEKSTFLAPNRLTGESWVGERRFKKVTLLENPEDRPIVRIDRVAISLFHYPLISPPIKSEKFPPLTSKEDIAAGKKGEDHIYFAQFTGMKLKNA